MVLHIRALFVTLTLAVAAVCLEPTAALNVKLHGVNYDLRRGPDWDSQRCKPSTVVTNDLKKLSQLTNRIRIYSLEDCNVRQVLRTAPTLNMTVWLGMWVSDKESVFRKEVSELKLLIRDGFLSEDVVSAINVGSEVLYRKETTGEVLIENFNTVQQILASAKLNISVSVTDTLGELVNNPDVIDAVDVISFNQFPFWNNISVNSAAADLEYAVESLSNSTNKPFVIAETGWAAGGSDDRASDATPENAAKFLKDFYLLAEKKEWKYYYFVGFDAPFLKTHNGSKDSVEAYFGLFNASGKLNTHYEELTIPAKTMLDGEFTPLQTSAPKTSSQSDSAATAISITTLVVMFSAVVAALLA